VNEIFPDEGLDALLGYVPKGGATPAAMYCGLFWSPSNATAVPAASAVLSSQTGVGEVTGWGYARVIHNASAWGVAGAKTIWGQSARGVLGAQLSFASASATYSVPIVGFFLSTGTGFGTGPAIFYSNFDDSTAIASLSAGDIIKVTPTFGLLG